MRNWSFNENKPKCHLLFLVLAVSLRGVPMSLTTLVLWASFSIELKDNSSALCSVYTVQLLLYCAVVFSLFFEICQSFLIRKLSGVHQEVRCSFAAEKGPDLLTHSPRGCQDGQLLSAWQPQDSEFSLPSTSTSDSTAHLGVQWAWGLLAWAMTLESSRMLLFHRADTDHQRGLIQVISWKDARDEQDASSAPVIWTLVPWFQHFIILPAIYLLSILFPMPLISSHPSLVFLSELLSAFK